MHVIGSSPYSAIFGEQSTGRNVKLQDGVGADKTALWSPQTHSGSSLEKYSPELPGYAQD